MKIKKFNESREYKEVKTISELIDYLQKVKEKEEHEYWGSVETLLSTGYNLNVSEHAQPDGPKSGKSVKALVFGK